MSEFRILIVENQSTLALELKARLARQGYAIVGTAGSNEIALALLTSVVVDLVLLGLGLGAHEAVALARELQRRGVPFVLLTTQDEHEIEATVRRHLSEQTQPARELEVVGHVVSGVAHDCNNLLSVVWMTTHMLRQAPPSELPGLLDELEHAMTLGASHTTRLLSLARRSDTEPGELWVNDALRAIVQLARRMVGAGVDIALDLDPSVQSVEIAPMRFHQMILDLTLDASRALDAGGHLSICSRAETRDGEAVVVIAVGDTDRARSRVAIASRGAVSCDLRSRSAG